MTDINAHKESFLKELRAGTDANHKALEQNPYSERLMSPDVTVEDYKIYLEKMYGIIMPFEQDIQPKLSHIVTDMANRQKHHLLSNDLQDLGNNTENIPLYHFNAANDAAALGQMYVLEGSTMGGMVIQKHMSKLGVPVRYFASYGSNTAMMWRAFIDALTTYAVTHNKQEEIIDSAVATFKTMDNWLSGDNK